jgi:hypothetical protein
MPALTLKGQEADSAAQVGSVGEGRRLARESCSQCHLLVEEMGRSTVEKAHPFRAIAKTPGMTSAALRVILVTPHRHSESHTHRAAAALKSGSRTDGKWMARGRFTRACELHGRECDRRVYFELKRLRLPVLLRSISDDMRECSKTCFIGSVARLPELR